MSKKGKGRRAADEMKDAVKDIAAQRQREAVVESPTLEIGKTYYDADGNSYELTAITNEVVTAKRGGKKIPFQMVMFEELVGLNNAEVLVANAAKGADKVAVNKAAAEKKVAAEQAAAEARKAQKEARKATAGADGRRVSGMWVIRDTLAKNPNATVEDISVACEKAGVPKGNSTIVTIMSDFKQTYQALLDAGRIRTLH